MASQMSRMVHVSEATSEPLQVSALMSPSQFEYVYVILLSMGTSMSLPFCTVNCKVFNIFTINVYALL